MNSLEVNPTIFAPEVEIKPELFIPAKALVDLEAAILGSNIINREVSQLVKRRMLRGGVSRDPVILGDENGIGERATLAYSSRLNNPLLRKTYIMWHTHVSSRQATYFSPDDLIASYSSQISEIFLVGSTQGVAAIVSNNDSKPRNSSSQTEWILYASSRLTDYYPILARCHDSGDFTEYIKLLRSLSFEYYQYTPQGESVAEGEFSSGLVLTKPGLGNRFARLYK